MKKNIKHVTLDTFFLPCRQTGFKREIFSLTILFLFVFSFCQAQQLTTENYVSRLFEKPEQIQWIKHYKGRIDDLTDIALTMGFDGKNCKGQITYLRSAEKIEVEGKISNEEFMFQEVNKAKEVSGVWEGKISGKFILGTWTNAQALKGGKILLEEVSKEATFPTYCGCLLYTSPSPRDRTRSRMPSSA